MRKLIAALAAAAFISLTPSIASATVPPDDTVVPVEQPGDPTVIGENVDAEVGHEALEETDSLARIQLSTQTVQFVIALLIPLLVGLFAKYRTWLAVVTIVLNGVQTLITDNIMNDGSSIISQQAFISFLLTTAVALATYARVYKPLGLTNAPDGKFAGFGI